MPRATAILGATTILGIASTLWLYFDNRALQSKLDDAAAPAQVATPEAPKTVTPDPDPWNDAVKKDRDAKVALNAGAQPSLPADTRESRMERRAKRTEEFGQMFGRDEGETEEEYRARIVPLIKMGLAGPRDRVAEMRKIAEEKAHVTPEQSAKLDKAFNKVYDDVLTYTNKAVQDGQLSPYERNVAGWLDFAGGLGGILTDAQGQVGKVLDPGQMKTMYDAGFEWGEYLGAMAPWENLKAPPPHKP